MSLLDAIGGTSMRYVLGVIILALAAGNAAWWLHAHALENQLSARDVQLQLARAEIQSLTAAKDACAAHTSELAASNLASQQAIDQLRQALAAAQGETQRLQAEGRKAIASAQARAEDADRALKTFIDRYAAQIKNPDCAGALNTVQHACPALEGY